MPTRKEVYEAIDAERQYQMEKFGDKPQSLPGFIAILRSELNEAEVGWIKNKTGRNSPLAEIIQIAAVAVACAEKYGTRGNTFNTDDIPGAE